MDTTETYIKMRLAAIPDLGMGNPPSVHNHHIGKDVWVAQNGDFYYFTEDTACQLERQDQLQEMVIHFGHGHSNGGILVGLSMFSQEYGYNETSMEQLWLAFVMKEKFNKTWNGENWLETRRG